MNTARLESSRAAKNKGRNDLRGASRPPVAGSRARRCARAELGSRIFVATQRVAIAMKAAFKCEGVSTRQHNESAGNQDMWHYHVHVTPRFKDDDFY